MSISNCNFLHFLHNFPSHIFQISTTIKFHAAFLSRIADFTLPHLHVRQMRSVPMQTQFAHISAGNSSASKSAVRHCSGSAFWIPAPSNCNWKTYRLTHNSPIRRGRFVRCLKENGPVITRAVWDCCIFAVNSGQDSLSMIGHQSQDSAPPVWYSVTRVSKKFFSFLRSIISAIHGNGLVAP